MAAPLALGSPSANGATPAHGQQQLAAHAERIQYLQVPQPEPTPQRNRLGSKTVGIASLSEVQMHDVVAYPSDASRGSRTRTASGKGIASGRSKRAKSMRTDSTASNIRFHDAGIQSVFGVDSDTEDEDYESAPMKCYPKLSVVLLVAFISTLLPLGLMMSGMWWSRDVDDTHEMRDTSLQGIKNFSKNCKASVGVVVKESHDRNTHAILEVVRDLLKRAGVMVTLNKDILVTHSGFQLRNLTKDYLMMFAEMRDRLSEVDYVYLADDTGLYAGYGYYFLNTSSKTWFGAEYRPPDNFQTSPVICPDFCPPLSEMKPGEKNYYFADNETGRFLGLYRPPNEYDPRKREWYQRSIAAPGRVVWTAPYYFSNGLTFGLTASISTKMPVAWDSSANKDAYIVFGADFALDIFSQQLQSLALNRTTRTFIVEINGMMIASSGHRSDVLSWSNATGKLERLMWNETGDPSVVAPIKSLTRNNLSLAEVNQSGVDRIKSSVGTLVVAWIKWDWAAEATSGLGAFKHTVEAPLEAETLASWQDPWIIFSVQPEAEYLESLGDVEQRVRRNFEAQLRERATYLTRDSWKIVAVCVAFMLLGTAFIAWVSRAVVHPLKAISADMFSIAKLEFMEVSELAMQGDDSIINKWGRDRVDSTATEDSRSEASNDGSDSGTESDPQSVKHTSTRPSSRRKCTGCWCWNRLFHKVQKVASLRIREVTQMREAFEFMSSGLRSFSRYMDPHVVQLLVESKKQAELGVAESDLTIFFSDIANFTSMAEVMEPKDFMDLLAMYLDEMSLTIMQHKGVVGEYIGDAIMAWWNAPIECENHTLCALRAALAQQARLRRLRGRWRRQGKPDVRARMGLVRGTVLAGNIGSSSRMKFGLVGDAVNLASRLEGLCKRYEVSILLDENAHNAPGVADEFLCRPVDLVVVKGRQHPTELFELVGCRRGQDGELVDDRSLRFVDDFVAIHSLYRAGQFEQALQALDEYRAEWPDDGPARILHERCAPLVEDPPDLEEEWSAVEWMKSK